METLAEERARQLVHAERLSTIGEMSAGIAHEINNYLAPVLGYTEMLGMKVNAGCGLSPEDSETFKSYLECIVKGTHRIRNLVERIRKHSRKTAGERSLCSVNDIVRQSLELSASAVKRLRLELSLNQKLPNVVADQQELEQVFVNLFKNAADAMEGKGACSLRVSSGFESGAVVVSVSDSGPGIPEDKIEHVFESFFTTKGPEKGTGLGLSVSKSIVERHGGSIKAGNLPGGGAIFTIALPPAAFPEGQTQQ